LDYSTDHTSPMKPWQQNALTIPHAKAASMKRRIAVAPSAYVVAGRRVYATAWRRLRRFRWARRIWAARS